MSVAFVLGGGGGPLGAHEVGMVRALIEAGIQPDLILGTSVGAINGVAVAADPSPAPHADVVVVGHVGVPVGFRDLWGCLPARQTVHLRMWLVGADEIPSDRDERIDWLFGCWRMLDDWVRVSRDARR